MTSINDLCKSHRRNYFYDDGEGLVGVHNHSGFVLWYRYIENVGYSLAGSTLTPQGSAKHTLS